MLRWADERSIPNSQRLEVIVHLADVWKDFIAILLKLERVTMRLSLSIGGSGSVVLLVAGTRMRTKGSDGLLVHSGPGRAHGEALNCRYTWGLVGILGGFLCVTR